MDGVLPCPAGATPGTGQRQRKKQKFPQHASGVRPCKREPPADATRNSEVFSEARWDWTPCCRKEYPVDVLGAGGTVRLNTQWNRSARGWGRFKNCRSPAREGPQVRVGQGQNPSPRAREAIQPSPRTTRNTVSRALADKQSHRRITSASIKSAGPERAPTAPDSAAPAPAIFPKLLLHQRVRSTVSSPSSPIYFLSNALHCLRRSACSACVHGLPRLLFDI